MSFAACLLAGRGSPSGSTSPLRVWQGELAILQALDEGGPAQMRPDPGTETLVKLPGLLESIRDFTQLAQ